MQHEINPENKEKSGSDDSYEILHGRIRKILENYSNVHRGSGFKSQVTTHLYEKAKEIVLRFLRLSPSKYVVIFCSRYRAGKITANISKNDFKIISSADFGISLGVYAVAVKKKALPVQIPFITGGGTTKLYSKNWIVPATLPDNFEAGTPAIINCIVFATILKMNYQSDNQKFLVQKNTTTIITEIFYEKETHDSGGEQLLKELGETVVGRNTKVPTVDGLKKYINLDNAASTPAFEKSFQAYFNTLIQPKLLQNEIIREAEKICADLLGAPENEYEIIFSSNTTESINFVTECLAEQKETDIEPVVLISDLEHSSNDLPWRQIPGWQVERLPVNKLGFWELNVLERILEEYNTQKLYGLKRINLIAVSGASNVLGSCNNLEETSRIVHKFGAQLLVDGAQLVAHREINISKNSIDFFAFSGHKIYAPFGTGVLIAKKGFLTDEKKLAEFKKSGIENPGGIAALAKSSQLLKKVGYENIAWYEEILTRKTIKGLRQIQDVRIFGIDEVDSPLLKNKTGVIGFDIKNRAAGGIAKKLSLQAGIGTRYGCHCAHVLIKYLLDFTPRLEKIQRFVVQLVPPLKLQGFIRVSFGLETTESDINLLITEIQKITAKTKTPDLKSTKKLVNDAIRSVSNEIYSI